MPAPRLDFLSFLHFIHGLFSVFLQACLLFPLQKSEQACFSTLRENKFSSTHDLLPLIKISQASWT